MNRSRVCSGLHQTNKPHSGVNQLSYSLTFCPVSWPWSSSASPAPLRNTAGNIARLSAVDSWRRPDRTEPPELGDTTRCPAAGRRSYPRRWAEPSRTSCTETSFHNTWDVVQSVFLCTAVRQTQSRSLYLNCSSALSRWHTALSYCFLFIRERPFSWKPMARIRAWKHPQASGNITPTRVHVLLNYKQFFCLYLHLGRK